MLRPGKLPLASLETLLSRITHADPRVLIGPAAGRDAAVLDLGGGRVLIAKADPVTFAAEDIGWYAVHVNANDVACMGGRPAWFLATVLLPAGAPDTLPGDILGQAQRAASALGVEIIGGHTEVTSGIERPIVAGAMLGECTRDALIMGDGVEAGDLLVLTGPIAVEGTALLAREAASAARVAGVDDACLARARRLLYDPGISIVGRAAALTAIARPKLLHDPTEGGIATALAEVAAAAGLTLRVDGSALPVLDDTRTICGALALDPLGLLSSGALLAVMPAAARAALEHTGGAEWRIIGRLEAGPRRVILEPGDIPFPSFERDEIARFFDSGMSGGTLDHNLEGSEHS